VAKVQPDRNAPEKEREKFQYKVRQTKDEILKLLSPHDSKAAEELAKGVKQEEKEAPASSSQGQAETAESLVRMARAALKDDPKRGLEFGVKSLREGRFAQEFVVLLVKLYEKDQGAGHQLLFSGIDKLATPGADVIGGLTQLTPLAVAPQLWERDPTLRQGATRLMETFSAVLTETALAVRQGQNVPKEIAWGLVRLGQERFIPALQATNSERLVEMQQLVGDLSARLEARYQKVALIKSIGAAKYENFESELAKAEGERDAAMRDVMLRALALGAALKRKEYENARRAAEKIQELELRIETRDDVNLAQSATEAGNQNFDEAVRRAREIGDLLLRTRAFVWIVARAAKKDEVSVRQILDAAYSSALQVEASAEKAQSLVALAETYAQYDVARAFEIYFAAAQVMNRMGSLPAAKQNQPRERVAVVSFEISTFEKQLRREWVVLEDITYGRGLERLGQEDYHQAMLLANSVKHDILRARMQLAVCRGVLGKKPAEKEAQKK
jgi:hypothetical protein